ncbi:MAG: DUF3048 domain-containing protein [Patescibacteria group bacterium]|jgi:hypothetical protein|nr:DUF3048 domain-containing protein [Patescibacteria group bacterium]
MKKISDWIKLNIFFVLALILILFVFVALVFYYFTTGNNFQWNLGTSHLNNFGSSRLLDGARVMKTEANLKPIAVMIENHADSRPVAGLDQASIVYEMVVEGDITRFLAIFDQNFSAKKIGPVRSARPFFVELAEEWNPVYFHAGGSQEALEILRRSPIYNINEISADGIYFWRDSARGVPHNLYTSSDLIKRALAAKGIDLIATFEPWNFKDDNPVSDQQAIVSELVVDFSNNPLYSVRYQYDAESNDYRRYLGNGVHKTETGIILKVKNIVVQHTKADVIDSYGRLAVDLATGGRAEIYQDGRKIDAYWVYQDGRTKFFIDQQNSEEVKFNRGPIWIEIVFN